MIPRPDPSRRRLRRSPVEATRPRRAFVLLIALGVFVIATLTISWNITRMNVYVRTIDARVNVYDRHHEQLAIGDIVSVWLTRVQTARMRNVEGPEPMTLDEFAASPEADFQMILPDGKLVTLHLQDGQGSLLANLGLAGNLRQEELMLNALLRLPPDRPDLVRTAGPWTVSIRAAPDPLIDAIAGDNLQLARALKDVRDDPEFVPANLRTFMAERRIDVAQATPVLDMITFSPTVWTVLVEVREPDAFDLDDDTAAARGHIRWYDFLMVIRDNFAETLERRRLDRQQFEASLFGIAEVGA